jgi:predicted ATPase
MLIYLRAGQIRIARETQTPQGMYNPLATHWCVITGAPCAGKSAVIAGLAQRGFRVLPEAARAYIDTQLARGFTLAQIKADTLAFERSILLAKVRLEAQLPLTQTVFLDRAVPDSIAYFRLEGLDDTEPLALSRAHRYQKIFLLDRLDFEKDAVRSENRASAARLEALLLRSYIDLGYAVISVPVMPIDQRVDYVLERVRPA